MSDTLTFYSGPFGFNSSLKHFQWEFGEGNLKCDRERPVPYIVNDVEN